jgi:phenylacetate-coenzyme A ligase PaaK-like adenylate-forming protein
MAVAQEDTSYLMQLNRLLTPYLPPRDMWNPADEVIYQPRELYRVPLEEARDMQLKAIKFTFTHHYNNNDFYHKYCEMRNVRPDDIKTVDDLDTIPLIPDTTFKEYPSGEDFAHWLAAIFTGKLPKIVIKGSNPTYDDVINAFNAAGLVVTYSSGTSGRHTFIPRDMKTFVAGQYAGAMSYAGIQSKRVPDHVYLLFPNPKKTNLFIGKVNLLADNVYKDVQYAVDYEISTESLSMATRGNQETEGQARSYVQSEALQKMVDQTTVWLERYEKTEETIGLSGPPFMLHYLLSKLQKKGTSFHFGERGRVVTGGGWKIQENARIPHADFRKLVEDVLGIPETRCFDAYAMVEGNATMLQCPEGHYLHAPYTFYKPLVLDNDLMPTGYGEWGRFAFLDAIAQSYPGFIISGDRVRMLEHCPVCDRPGPVLDPEVQRARGEEMRGCAEELRRVLAEDLAR